jgi:hypothetical protein
MDKKHPSKIFMKMADAAYTRAHDGNRIEKNSKECYNNATFYDMRTKKCLKEQEECFMKRRILFAEHRDFQIKYWKNLWTRSKMYECNFFIFRMRRS